MTSQVLLLTPSAGRGGGIERYVETLQWAFSTQGIESSRIDLNGSGSAAHARLLLQCRQNLRAAGLPTRVVVAHPALLPVAWLAAREVTVEGISLVCHGIDIWGTQLRPRRLIENYLMRRPRVRVVSVSSFTAGVLFRHCRATVLSPGLSRMWFETLVNASAVAGRADSGIRLVTVFRLADWRDKGLPELLDAVDGLECPDVGVTVCGTGVPPTELQRLVGRHRFCTLRNGLSDDELALELASADLCVLATRTRFGRDAYGEGFGFVLMEAQIAGTPVVAPAYGGSHDAYIPGVTGVAPVDESAMTLRTVLDGLVRDPARLDRMSKQAADWARECFAPEKYAAQAVMRLL